MQIHGPSVVTTEIGVRLNPGGGKPFAILDFGDVRIHLANVADADVLITAACEAKRLLVTGAAPEPEPAGPVCGQRQTGGKALCTRPAGHKGGHRNDATDAYWPQGDGEA